MRSSARCGHLSKLRQHMPVAALGSAAHLNFNSADDALLDLKRQLQVIERLNLQPYVVQNEPGLPCCDTKQG
jgi:hypothetical protein